jgi:hypothetical protein
LKDIRSVLLLFDIKDYSEAKLFIKQLRKMGKKVNVCAFKDKTDKNDYSATSHPVVTEKDVNLWNSDALSKAIHALGSGSYDLAINLTLQENLLLQYILVSINSTFKVGFNRADLPICDMVISFAPQMESDGIITIRELSKQVIHYLTIISSGDLKNKKTRKLANETN